MPDPKPYKPPYAFSVTIGETCARKLRTFQDLADKLKMDVTDLMRQANGHTSPSKAVVKAWQRSSRLMSHTWRSLPRLFAICRTLRKFLEGLQAMSFE
jgi:hypothetical protein